MNEVLKAPFPWFGGKSTVAGEVWSRFGHIENFVDPFMGSCAACLGNPDWDNCIETVNDINGWLTNAWRGIRLYPDETAWWADYPVVELDLYARGDWLFYRPEVEEWLDQVRGGPELIEDLRGDPFFCDPLSAGWWVWGQSSWIGDNWGRKDHSNSVSRSMPFVATTKGQAGMGIQKKSLTGRVARKRPNLFGREGDTGKGINRKSLGVARQSVGRGMPDCGSFRSAYGGRGCHDSQNGPIHEYFNRLSARLRRVRICCGDWKRVLGPSVTVSHGTTAVFLDPPYSTKDRSDCYGEHDSRDIAHDVREWAIEWGKHTQMRIALCGYLGEHEMPKDWRVYQWQATGGYGNQRKNGTNKNKELECIWFSPHCLDPQPDLFNQD